MTTVMPKNTRGTKGSKNLADFETAPPSNLADLLPPRSDTSTPDDEATETATDGHPAAVQQQPPATTTRRRGHTAEPDGGTERLKPSSVHLPTSLVERIKEFQASAEWTNGQVLVAALEDCHQRGRIGALAEPRAVGGALFGDAWTAGRPASRAATGPKVPFSIVIPPPFYAIIDQLVAEAGAASRSHLAMLAIEDYLTHHTASETD